MRRLLAIGVLAWALPGAPAAAQGGPPPPLPLRDVVLPELHERVLDNGARLVVVPQHEVPFVTLNVVLPGGSAADPPGREGVAAFVAQLLDRGAGDRSRRDIATALDRLGASVATEVDDEWSTLSLNVTTPALEPAMEIVADLLLRPTFPADEIEQVRTRALTGLQVQSSRPSAVADRAFTRAVYGDHPYGRSPTPASVSALSRDDLVAFHRDRYRPDGALLVVSGDVDPVRIEAVVAHAFAGWDPASRPEPSFPRAPDRERPEVVVVHQPGTVQAEIRMGHLLPGGDLAGWERLVVANEVLGGGPPGRLQQVLREALGYTYDARSTLTRGRRLGLFRIATAVRTEVAAPAVEEILAQVERLRTRALPAAELDDRVSYLVGSLPRFLETPQQVAAEVTTHRLLGLPPSALEATRERLAAVDTAEVRAAAELGIRPEQFLIVVAGDAGLLQPRLRGLGEVSIVDAEGRSLTLADLAPGPSTERFDLRGLTPATLTYRVLAAGVVRGEAVRTLEAVDGGWRFASAIEAGAQRLEQEVVVDDELGLVSTRSVLSAPAGTVRVEGRRDGDRVRGEVVSGPDRTPVDLQVPEGATLSDGLELALWASELAVGREIRLPVADLQSRTVTEVVLRVEEETEVTVPAGTFPVFRVSVTGRDPQTFFVRTEAPHIPVRMESATRPVALELAATGGR